jgi:hypothetical protein
MTQTDLRKLYDLFKPELEAIARKVAKAVAKEAIDEYVTTLDHATVLDHIDQRIQACVRDSVSVKVTLLTPMLTAIPDREDA